MKPSRLALLVTAVAATGAMWWRSQGGDGQAQVVDVTVPALNALQREGEALFGEHCATCHGRNAAGSGNGPPLVHIIYEPGHHADGAFQMAVMRGVRAHHWEFGDMPPVPGLSNADLTKIIAYVRALQHANGIR